MRPSHQVPGTLLTSVRFPPAARAQAQAEITPPGWEGCTKSKKPGSRSASGKLSLIPTLGPWKSACSIKFGSASQLRQGAHQNTRREQRFASCSGFGFLSGNTCNILLAEGVGEDRGRPCNRCRCSCRARQRPSRLRTTCVSETGVPAACRLPLFQVAR